jgi:hypothetical protein
VTREVGKCTGCNAPIFWAVTSAGKRIPVDVTPVRGGNIRIFESPTTGVATALYQPKPAPEEESYVSHFATCPEAASFRRRR